VQGKHLLSRYHCLVHVLIESYDWYGAGRIGTCLGRRTEGHGDVPQRTILEGQPTRDQTRMSKPTFTHFIL
jgi:hypothetical protein